MALTQISTNGIKNNTITGTDLATNLDLGDNRKIRLGNDQDLEIVHDTSNGVIRSINSGGNMHVESKNHIELNVNYNTSSGYKENALKAIANSGVSLFFDGSQKFSTTSTGVSVTGNVDAGSNAFLLNDSGRIRLGASQDFEIYHDGSNSLIKDAGTGALVLSTNQLLVRNAAINEFLIQAVEDAGVKLYYDNSKKLETTSSGISVTGSINATGQVKINDSYAYIAGTGNDLQIYHDGTNSFIKNSTGNLRIQDTNGNIQIQAKAGEESIIAKTDGEVELYHNNIKKFETYSDGIKVIGQEGTSAALQLVADDGDDNGDTWELRSNQDDNDLTFKNNISGSSVDKLTLQNDGDLFTTGDVYLKNDSKKLKLGASDDLQIYHDGTNSFIDNSTGNLYLRSGGNAISIRAKDDEQSILCHANGAVELYYDNSKKLETTTNGIIATGNDAVGNILIGDLRLKQTSGDTTYVKWDASHSKLEFMDNVYAMFGDGNDLEIFHNGSNSYIRQVGVGNLHIRPKNNEEGIVLIPDGAVELYYNASKKLETNPTGITVSGNATFGDGVGTVMGASNDLQIYHDGSHSYITRPNGSDGQLLIRANHSDNGIVINNDGAVELYHNGSKKFETTSTGVSVAGNAVFTGNIQINDNSFLYVGNSGDLDLHHNGTNSYIRNKTGNLHIRPLVAEEGIILKPNNGIELYYDNSLMLDVKSWGVEINGDLGLDDNRKLALGNLPDFLIYHDGTHSRIKDVGTGILSISTNQCNIQNAAVNENMAEFFENGAVNLYYDNGKKFETRSDGVKLSQGHFYADDHSRIKLGDGQDLELYHDGTNSSIKNTTGDLYIYDTGGNIYIQANTPEQSIIAFANGSTELYYDNSIRIRTQSYGIEYHNQQHKFMHTNSGGVGAYLSLMNPGTAAGGKTGIVFGIGNSNAILDGTDYGEGQIKCFTDSGYYGNLEFNLHVGANRSWMKIVGNGAAYNGAGAGSEGMRGGVAFGCAGIAIDRSWTGQPGIHVFNANSEGDTDQGTFRFHGWNRSYASYPNNSGSDFSVNLVADGTGLSSDERRKTGIATITNALDTITKMRGVSFQFVNRELDPQTHMSMDNGKKLGFIAQEVIPLLPQLILDSGEKNVPLENGWCDRYSMDYSGVTAVLVEAIKELAAKVASLESKITE